MQIRRNLLVSSSIIALVISLAHVADAADVTWDGETDSDWFTATNWDTDSLPVADDYVFFTDADAPDAVVSGGAVALGDGRVYVDANTLTIEGGGSVSDRRGNIGFFAGSNGTVTVTGAGSSWVNSGALTVGSRGIGALVIENGGMVSNGNAFVGRYAGSQGGITVTGSGTSWVNNLDLILGFDGTGTLTVSDGGTVSADIAYIANQATATGTLNIGGAPGDPATSPGTLNVPSVNFGLGAGEVNFNHTGTNYVFAPNIIGSGDVNVNAGVTALIGDTSAFTGLTSLNGGTLNVTNSMQLADITAFSGVIDLSRDSAPGTTLTVNGDFDLQAGSTMVVNVTPTELNDNLGVNGNVSLGGDLRVEATGAQADYEPIGRMFVYTVIENDGADAVTGTFSNVTTNFAFLTPYLDYAGGTGNDVDLTLETSSVLDFTPFALTANQQQVADAMAGYDYSTVDGDLVYSNLSVLLDSEVPDVLDQLGGTGLFGVFTFGGVASLAFLDVIGNRDAQGPMGGPVISTKGGGFAMPGTIAKTGWASVFADYETVEGAGNAPGASIALGGFAAGSEVQIDNGAILGAAAGYSRAAFFTDGVASSGDANGYHLGLYGKAGVYSPFAEGFGLTGAVFASLEDYSTERTISFGGLTRTASADFFGYSFGGEVIGRYGMAAPTFGGVISPFGGLRYQNTLSNGFTETGAGGLNLTVEDRNQNQLTSILGVEHAGTQEIAGGALRHRISLSWEHDLLTTDGSADFMLGGSPTPFMLQTANMGGDNLVLGGGLDMDLSGRGAISVDGKAEVSGSGIGFGGSVSYKVEF